MAIVSGFQDITTGERESDEFDFRGGRIGYAVTDVPNATPNWDLQVKLPGDVWVRVHANAHEIDQGKPYDTLFVPAGTYRLRCDTTSTSHWQPVKLFWAYVPATLRDAALN